MTDRITRTFGMGGAFHSAKENELQSRIAQLTTERDEWKKKVEELTEQLEAQETLSEIQQMALQDKNDISMTEANSLLRSAWMIANRNGEQTNWEAFKNRVYEELVREHNKTYSDNNKGE